MSHAHTVIGMNKLTVATVPCTLLAFAAPLAAQEVVVSEDRLISDSELTWPLTEPHLTANPNDAQHLVATAIGVRSVNWSVEFSTTCFIFVSRDGGISWTRHDLDLEECGDPWLEFTPAGTVVFTALGRPRHKDDGLWVWRSADGGGSWPDVPEYIGRGFDHQTMTVDRSDGEFSGDLYLVAAEGQRRPEGGFDYGVHVGRSNDGGLTFPLHEHFVPSNLSLESQNPVVLSDGVLVVPFQDHQARPRRRLERRRSWLVVSHDGGATYSAPKLITESCARTRPASWPSLAVDRSNGPFRDRLYWICEEQDFAGVLVHVSADRGETWSEPLRIGHVGVRNPYTKTPVMAVSDAGALGIVWYDGRGHSWHACHQIYFSYSSNGGETFSEPLPISNAPSCPYTPQNGDAAWRWPGGGDYIGMVSVTGGRFVVAWSDSRDGIYRLRAATITLP